MKRMALAVLSALVSLPLWAAPMVASPTEAFVLLNNASVYKEKSLGVVEWSDTATLGDKVTVQGGIGKYKVDGKEREFYKVRLPNGKDGFLRTSVLGLGGTMGAVKNDNTLTYSEPRDVKITARTLPRAQVVMVLKDGSTDQFIHVVGYDEAKDTTIDTFVTPSDVSINDVDVNAIILLTVAKASKADAVKKNLLNLALTKYSTSQFLDLVRLALDPKAGAVRATKPASGSATINDDNVNVRDLPNEVTGKVLGTLEKGRAVTILEMTVDSYTVGGQSAPWYRIDAPAGWVFGSFLALP